MINGFTVTGTSSYGIYVAGGSNNVVTNNTVSSAGRPASGSAMVGIYINGLAGGTVSGNATHDNSAHGIQLTATTTGVTVQGNTSYHNAYQYQRAAIGIYVQGPGNSIIGNVTYGNEDSGIGVDTSANNTLIADNVSYGNGDHGIDNRNVTSGHVTGNTVYFNCTDGINVEGTAGSYVIENNIAVDNATAAIINPTPINPPGAYTNACNRRTGNIGVYDSAPATSTANYNLVWQDGAGVEYEWAGTSYPSQAALTTATGEEAHGIFADPKFANVATSDLQLTEGSPAIDSADSDAPGEQATDILGSPRVDDPATPNTGAGSRIYDDRGAYEFHPAAYTPVGPVRVLDTRNGTGHSGAVGAGQTISLQLPGQVPPGATTVVLNVTATGGTASSYVTVFPHGSAPPTASNLNFTAGETIPNLVIVPVVGGMVDFYNHAGSVNLVADLAGYYSPGGSSLFNSLFPMRVMDTRNGTGHSGAVGANSVISLQLPAEVPPGATAVVLNVTATGGTASSYVTVFPHGSAPPTASNLNFTAGETIPNLVIVPVVGGMVDFYNHAGSVNLVADLAGYYSPSGGSHFNSLGPTRVLDTRSGTGHSGAVGAGQTISLQLPGRVPPGATAVVLNVTATGGTASSYVTVFPHGSAPPTASNLNFTAGETIPNLVIVPVVGGMVDFYNRAGSVNLVADLAGYYIS